MKSKYSLVALAIFIAAVFCAAHLRQPGHSGPAQVPTILSSAATPAPARPSFRIAEESRAAELAAELLRGIAAEKPTPRKRVMNPARSGANASRLQAQVEVPDARFALSYVGADELAEEIWNAAINDPSIPPNERQDLIEDLNEEGFADPQNVTLDDLPLILRRLALIEQVAPDAIDEVNADALAEAYEDLVNMAAGLAQQ